MYARIGKKNIELIQSLVGCQYRTKGMNLSWIQIWNEGRTQADVHSGSVWQKLRRKD